LCALLTFANSESRAAGSLSENSHKKIAIGVWRFNDELSKQAVQFIKSLVLGKVLVSRTISLNLLNLLVANERFEQVIKIKCIPEPSVHNSVKWHR